MGNDMKRWILTLLHGMLLVLASGALAQTYPQKPVRIVVGNPAGQATDGLARLYAAQLGTLLGQSFIVENKPGAGATIAAAYVAKAAPDGYTLLVGTSATHGISYATFENPGYHPIRDFVPVGVLGRTPMVIAAPVSPGVKSLRDLIAQSNRSGMSVAVPSPMASYVLDSISRQEKTGFRNVPYTGSPTALNDILGGHVQALVDTPAVVGPQVANGKLVALGVTSTSESALMPGVKTVAEQGFPGFEVTGWLILTAPKDTPPAVVAKLNEALKKIHASPDFHKQVNAKGFDVAPVGEVPQLIEYVKSEVDRWVRATKGVEASTK
jgi:tripartite-type tricarboxylate transporter receptor subunit TctC